MATQPVRYALGRNSTFRVYYPFGGSQSVALCVSTGSISLSANVIELPSNCFSGWVVKLPGNKSGTVTLSGYAASGQLAIADGPLQPMKWHGEFVSFECEVYDSQSPTPGQAIYFACDGVVTAVETSIGADESVNVDLTIEITGAPVGYIGMANGTAAN